MISDEKIIEILISERDYHNSHPQAINAKAAFAVASLSTALLISYPNGSTNLQNLSYSDYILLGIGFLLLAVGLLRHTIIHHRQRDHIEIAINQLITGEKEGEEVINELKKTNNCIKLDTLSVEPDTRIWYRGHHDTLIFGGIISILILSFIIFI